MEVSHLLFANDTLCFLGANVQQLNYYWVLYFELILGLRVNMQERKIISIDEVEDLDILTFLFGSESKVRSLPSIILGCHWVLLISLLWYGI